MSSLPPPPDPLPDPRSREPVGSSVGGASSAEATLRASHRLLQVITEVQQELILHREAPAVLHRLLGVALELTGSTAGSFGELLHPPDGVPSFQPLASLPSQGQEPSWELPRAPVPAPTGLRALLEAVSLSDGPVVLGAGGEGPSLLGLPLEHEGVRVGLVGLAHRPGGYDAGVIAFLQPLIRTWVALLVGWRKERQRDEAERRLHHELETSAGHARRVMESLRDGVWDLDYVTGEGSANSSWSRMLGYGEGELRFNRDVWRRLCHPEDRPEVDRHFHEHMAARTPHIETEQRLRRKDGSWLWVLTRAQVVTRDAEGRPLRLVGTNVDISTHKVAEERLRAMLNALPDIVFRVGADGTYREYFVRDEGMLLVPGAEILGFNMRMLPLPLAQIDKLLVHLARAIREGSLEIVEYMLPMPDGLRHFEMRMVRSAPDEVISLVRDITERKVNEVRLRQQDEELRRHRDSLEELVRNRSERLLQATLELEEQQAQLIQTEKLASLGQMAAGVAHEINNPVSYVMSNLGSLDQYVSSTLLPLLRLQRELLEAGEALAGSRSAELLAQARELWEREDVDYLLGDMPELIEESLAGTRRIKEIAQSLRSFAREDSGEPQLVDVNTELASTLKIVWNELKYKCEVKRDFGPLPPVSCHPTQISQVFTNLLVNASQAIQTRGEIRIRTRHEGSEVVVEIADSGQGMSQETLSRLFTPFFTTKPRGQGTGLGLSVSYGIIARHKGRIDVQSELGKGSTFTVRLPMAPR